jgi:hypothetical protein
MEFDWMTTKPVKRKKRTAETREDELMSRAYVLARLGYAKKRIEARLKQNLAWEYEKLGAPVVQKRLAAAVSEACRRAGLAAPAPSAKKR